jgi:hypothetical protein
VPGSDPESLRRRGRLNALKRHRAPDDPAVAEAARDLAAARAYEHLRAAVAASRAAQGLPPTVEDPATLERVAAVLRLVRVLPARSASEIGGDRLAALLRAPATRSDRAAVDAAPALSPERIEKPA